MLKRLFALLLCLLLVIPAAFAEEEEAAPIMEVHQMKLGYADGYFIRCGDFEMLIDGGNPNPKKKNDDVVNCLRELGVETLDMYIITHWHLDHCMNMNDVLAEFGDENTLVYGVTEEVPAIASGNGSDGTPVEVQMAPIANGVYQQMVMGDVIEVAGLTITCVGPDQPNNKGASNNDSLNFLIQYGTRKFLFTGDAAQSGEINNYFSELCADVDVLKFPHHGTETSEGSGVFEIGNKCARNISPTYVLVPSGMNNWKIYQYFKGLGVDIQRENVLTNSGDHVVILTDGGDYIEALIEQNPADYAPAGAETADAVQ